MNKIKAVSLAALLVPTTLYAKRPAPPPTDPVNCVECVNTVDIATGAVTEDKLSPAVQDKINQPQQAGGAFFNAYDAADNYLGIVVSQSYTSPQVVLLYHPATDVYYAIADGQPYFGHNEGGGGLLFSAPDCAPGGNVYMGIPMSAILGSNYLVGLWHNNPYTYRFFVPVPGGVPTTIDYMSVLNDSLVCTTLQVPDGRTGFPMQEVSNPLPFSFPLTLPLRYEYVGPR